ncbi:MAG: DUF523 domain-containing protein [Myxococcales bacterium]|nr:DUF523 domain-containing protein [Myxococcales bacterium]
MATSTDNSDVVVVSACLVGIRCRYDGQHREASHVHAAVAQKVVVPICPELLANMGVPRLSLAYETHNVERLFAEKKGLVDSEGRDRTEELLNGVQQAVDLALKSGARQAILKERSPSCGVRQVYVGNQLVSGRGMFTICLEKEGIRCLSDEELR